MDLAHLYTFILILATLSTFLQAVWTGLQRRRDERLTKLEERAELNRRRLDAIESQVAVLHERIDQHAQANSHDHVRFEAHLQHD